MPRVRITKVPLNWRSSWLVILFMVPTSFATVSSFKFLIIFSFCSIFSPRCPTLLEKGRKEGEETTYWPRNQGPCGCLTHTTAQPTVEQVALPTTMFSLNEDTVAHKSPKTCPKSDNLDVVLPGSQSDAHAFST